MGIKAELIRTYSADHSHSEIVWFALKLLGLDAEFNESDHPRDKDGKFTSASGGGRRSRTPPVDSNGVSYTKQSSRAVSKKDFNKAVSEINTAYHGYYKDQGPIFIHETHDLKGNAVKYYVECHGFNEYNIYGKRKIGGKRRG